MADLNLLKDLAELFKVFADNTRVRILYALFEKEEISAGGIAETLDMSASAISHQLRILKSAGLVKFKRDGKVNLYSLSDDHVKTIILMGIEHITEE